MQEDLVVVIAGQRHALPMDRVVQVRIHSEITRIPGAPDWVRGFVDHDGASVEVFDAARRLGSGELQLDARSCFIFLETREGCAAMLVDGVQAIVPRDQAIESGEHQLPAIDPEEFFQ